MSKVIIICVNKEVHGHGVVLIKCIFNNKSIVNKNFFCVTNTYIFFTIHDLKRFYLKNNKKRENAACLFCTSGSTKYFDLLLLTLLCWSK